MHTASNTTAHIDSLYLKDMWYGGLRILRSNHDVTVEFRPRRKKRIME